MLHEEEGLRIVPAPLWQFSKMFITSDQLDLLGRPPRKVPFGSKKRKLNTDHPWDPTSDAVPSQSVDCLKVPYFSVRSYMSIVDGPPFWSLDASETGESTKCPWLRMVEGTAGKNHLLIPTLFISPPLTNPNLNSDCCHMPHLS